MLLNLSNHPSSAWPAEQLRAAVEQYGSVQDMLFPNVPPEADIDAVRRLAEEYSLRIQTLDPKPTAVHLMGEMTFTYQLVSLLQAVGMLCIASTTLREVTEEGEKKISRFRFVRFRPYF
ncbi:MAG: CRISPR-associated protein [Saprospiraceae bacterium]|nr:CRISPR-associated protein [Saprospiraceae bacterium]MDW8483102.1 CRISPR-associated protein [Saprospiraceae bacterium]